MTSKAANLILSVGCVIVMTGAILKIMHLPYGAMITIVGFLTGGVGSYFYIASLKKRIHQLEQEIASHK